MHEIFSKLLIYNWKDLAEVGFFITATYLTTSWLSKDKQKPLVLWFYGYSFILISSFFLELHNINNFLLAALPAAIIFFFMIHQRELQKNFVAFKNLKPEITNLDWIDILLRASINAINSNKSFLCLVEGTDSLKGFINPSIKINAEIDKKLIDVLVKSPFFNEEKIVWVSNGKLISINAEWNLENKKVWISEKTNIEDWKQNAILFSSKTDALIFKANPKERVFDIVAQGKLSEKVSPNDSMNIISQFLRKNYSQLYKKEYENKDIKQANT